MKRKAVILFLIGSVLFQHIYAYNNLRIIDPMNPWWNLPAFISRTDLTITPQGSFMEVGIYLTFSTEPNATDTAVQLEAIYNFDLPADAIITDSWLWIEGKPEKALILDKWTASAIYEGVVERRQDPSILTKTGANSYELRVYPLRSDMPRKVKINYLIPANWSSSKVTVSVPLQLFEVGYPLSKTIYLYAQSDDTWGNPVLITDTTTEFTPYSGEEYPANYQNTVFYNKKNCLIGFNSPMENGLFINKFEVDEDEGYYQLALLPSAVLDVDLPKKICFLVDYTGSEGDIAGILKNSISNYMEQTDSFNIMISGIEIRKASESWVPANDSSINLAFESFEKFTNSYSILPNLIAEGMKFTGKDGAILAISDNYDITSVSQANQLIKDLGSYKPWPVIHVLDLNRYNNYTWMGDRPYYGNEYFYSLLTRQTHGNYVSLRNGKNISLNLEELVQSASGFINSFDLYSTLDQGFCYSRYNCGLTGSTAYLNRPILQTGRYNGQFPFKIIISGVYNEISFSEEYAIEPEMINNGDTITRQIWSGMYIQSLEQSPAGNEIIGEIIGESIENRILTNYTAFLVLEPGMEPEFSEENEFIDELPIGIEDESASLSHLTVSAYPNPFTSSVTFELEVPQELSDAKASLKIFNVSGQLIRILDLSEYHEGDRVKITWDGRDESGNEIEQGIYIVRFVSKNKTKTLRIVKIR
jgi:hypothetical protein